MKITKERQTVVVTKVECCGPIVVQLQAPDTYRYTCQKCIRATVHTEHLPRVKVLETITLSESIL